MGYTGKALDKKDTGSGGGGDILPVKNFYKENSAEELEKDCLEKERLEKEKVEKEKAEKERLEKERQRIEEVNKYLVIISIIKIIEV